MSDSLLAVDAMNWWSKIAKQYENDANRLDHEAAALKYEIPIAHPKLKESLAVMADCKYTLAIGYRMYARALIAHSTLMSQAVEETKNEDRNSSGTVPGTGITQGSSGSTEPC